MKKRPSLKELGIAVYMEAMFTKRPSFNRQGFTSLLIDNPKRFAVPVRIRTAITVYYAKQRSCPHTQYQILLLNGDIRICPPCYYNDKVRNALVTFCQMKD